MVLIMVQIISQRS